MSLLLEYRTHEPRNSDHENDSVLRTGWLSLLGTVNWDTQLFPSHCFHFPWVQHELSQDCLPPLLPQDLCQEETKTLPQALALVRWIWGTRLLMCIPILSRVHTGHAASPPSFSHSFPVLPCQHQLPADTHAGPSLHSHSAGGGRLLRNQLNMSAIPSNSAATEPWVLLGYMLGYK